MMKATPAPLNAVHWTGFHSTEGKQMKLFRTRSGKPAGTMVGEKGTSTSFARKALAGTATVAAVLGMSLAVASPASAATGSWKAYGNTNPITSSSSTWKCAGSESIASNVVAQVCAIRSPGGGSVQGAVIVRNNRSNLYSVSAGMDLQTSSGVNLGTWVCSSSGVGANSWSVCFGKTLAQSNKVDSVGIANGVSLGVSPLV
ncbi:hypothetical protein ACPZ19_31210 [Amycolatopsis lurida]